MATLAIAGLAAAGSAASAAGALGTVSTLLSVGTTIAGGISSMQQAEAQSKQLELQAQRDEINTRMEELDVGEDLIKTLSANTAAAAAAGIQSSGSAARAQEATSRKAEEELAVLKINKGAMADASKANISTTRRGGRAALATSLLSAGETGYGAYQKVKKVK